MAGIKTVKTGIRIPGEFTPEIRQEALKQLHDEDRIIIDFLFACVLLDIGKSTGYALARTGDMPGALRLKDTWKVRRADLKKFLYGEA